MTPQEGTAADLGRANGLHGTVQGHAKTNDAERHRATMPDDDCLHMGVHCPPNKCPDCGRFSSHSWDTGGYSTENGWNEYWGGTCSKHGEWSDSAA